MAVTWVEMADSEFDPEAPLTSAKMQGLNNHAKALAQGAAGAPSIVSGALAGYPWGVSDLENNSVTAPAIAAGAVGQSELASSVIGQGELITSTQNYSVLVTATSLTLQAGVVSSGGAYVLGFSVKHDSSGTVDVIGMMGRKSTSTSYQDYITMMASVASGSFISDILAKYITASPPYSFGAGDIPKFIFLLIDNATGDVVSTSSSIDPPWAHNGPTNIKPDYMNKARDKFRFVHNTSDTFESVKDNMIRRENYLASLRDFRADPARNGILVPITREYKNADMNLIPHPYVGVQPPDTTVVMLDPLSRTVQELADISASGESISFPLHHGKFVIGNTHMEMGGPQGLQIVSARWRNSGI